MIVNEGYICPKTVDKRTWVGGQSHNDKFGIKQIAKIVQITRTDSNEGWGMFLKFECCR